MKAVKTNLSGINKKAIRSVFFGVIIGCIVTMILMILSAIIFLQTGKLPNDYLDYITLAFLGIGGFAGGYISARLYKSSGLLYGAITGAIMFLIIFIAGLTTSPLSITIMSLYKFLVLVMFSSIGGILGVNKKQKIKIK